MRRGPGLSVAGYAMIFAAIAAYVSLATGVVLYAMDREMNAKLDAIAAKVGVEEVQEDE